MSSISKWVLSDIPGANEPEGTASGCEHVYTRAMGLSEQWFHYESCINSTTDMIYHI
jgi:hypothetical protein